MDQKILKTGNSLAVTIPAQLVRTYGLKPGQTVLVKSDHHSGRFTVTFPNSGQLSLLSK